MGEPAEKVFYKKTNQKFAQSTPSLFFREGWGG
jgi:hypothetical protein